MQQVILSAQITNNSKWKKVFDICGFQLPHLVFHSFHSVLWSKVLTLCKKLFKVNILLSQE